MEVFVEEEEKEEVQVTDLHALKKLYGLLQKSPTNAHSQTSENLDDKAKLVLKKLLDGATEKAFQSHSKITAEQPANSMNYTTTVPKPSKGSPKTSKASSKSHSIASSSNKIPRSSCRDIQNSSKDPNSNSCGKKRILHEKNNAKGLEIPEGSTSSENDRSIDKPVMKEGGKESESNKKPLHKRIRKVQYIRSIIESQPSDARAGSDQKRTERFVGVPKEDATSSKTIWDQKRPERFVGVPKEDASSSKTWAEFDMKRPERFVGVTEEDIAKAIKQMEAHDSFTPGRIKGKNVGHRRSGSGRMGLIARTSGGEIQKSRPNVGQGSSTVSSNIGTQDGVIQKNGPNAIKFMFGQSNKPVLDGNGAVLSRMVSQKDRLPSLTRKLTRDMSTLSIQKERRMLRQTSQQVCDSDGKGKKTGFPVPKASQTRKPVLDKNDSLRQVVSAKVTARMLSQTTKENQQRQVVKKSGIPTHPVQTPNLEPTLLRLDSVGPQTRAIEKHPPSTSKRVARKPSRQTVGSARIGGRRKREERLPSRRKVAISSSSSSSSSSPGYSPSWTSQETTSYSETESEEYSLPRRLPSKTTSHRHIGPTSNMGLKNRAREKSRRMTRHSSSTSSPPRRVGPTTKHHVDPTTIEKAVEKKIGRFRKFKNKLGVIFHHHHHHHHHHHDGSDSSEVGQPPSSNHSHSFWNNVREMLHRHTSKKDQKKQAANQMVKSMPRQNQHGYLHGLIDGLIKHMWKSKKSKPFKSEIKRLGRGQGSKKVVKKWHWWQRFYKSGGAIRRVNSGKPRVKIGFKARRPQLPYVKRN